MSEGAFLFSQEMVKEGETRGRRDKSKMKIKNNKPNHRRMTQVTGKLKKETVVIA